MKRFLVLLTFMCWVAPLAMEAAVASLPETGIKGLRWQAGGDFVFDGISFRLLHFGQDWRRSIQTLENTEGYYEKQADGSWVWRGKLRIGGKDFLNIREEISLLGNNSIQLAYAVSYPGEEGLDTNEMSLELVVPAKIAAGRSMRIGEDKQLLLPETAGEYVLAGNLRGRKFLVPSEEGSLLLESEEPMTLRVEDMRAWRSPGFDYRIRIRFESPAGKLQQGQLRLKLKHVSETGIEKRESFVVEAGKEWRPYEHRVDIEPGSVFDFSFLTDAPAGKYGKLLVNEEGGFEFEKRPGERVRFWGVNLCFAANFLNKEDADILARQLAASGYNTVRFHHYDAGLGRKGMRSDSYMDPDKLDRLDYLFHAMKREGLYISIDLYTIRSWNLTPEELEEMGIPPDSSVGKQHIRLQGTGSNI